METMSSNATLAAALRQMAESGRIPHAMLFHQNDGGGAFPLILDTTAAAPSRSSSISWTKSMDTTPG